MVQKILVLLPQKLAVGSVSCSHTAMHGHPWKNRVDKCNYRRPVVLLSAGREGGKGLTQGKDSYTPKKRKKTKACTSTDFCSLNHLRGYG